MNTGGMISSPESQVNEVSGGAHCPPHGFPFVVTVTSESLSVGPPGSFTPSRLSAPEGGWGQVLAAEEPPLPSSSQQQRFSAAPGLAALQACG